MRKLFWNHIKYSRYKTKLKWIINTFILRLYVLLYYIFHIELSFFLFFIFLGTRNFNKNSPQLKFPSSPTPPNTHAVSFAFDLVRQPTPLSAPPPWVRIPTETLPKNCTTVCHLVLRLEIPALGMAMEMDLAREGTKASLCNPAPSPLPPLLFALSPTIYSYILLWRIFSAKVFLARLVLWMKTFSVCAWLGLLGCPQKGVALLCFVFVSVSALAVSVSALLPHFIFTHFLRVSSFCFSVYFLSEEGGLMGIYFR